MKFFRTIFTPILAILVFLNATSFSMSMHLCMGEVKNLAFFQTADACENARFPINKEDTCEHINTKNCCEDRTVLIEGNQELVTETLDTFKNLDSIAVVYAVLISLVSRSSETTDSFETYIPPLILKDIPVLIQSFLI